MENNTSTPVIPIPPWSDGMTKYFPSSVSERDSFFHYLNDQELSHFLRLLALELRSTYSRLTNQFIPEQVTLERLPAGYATFWYSDIVSKPNSHREYYIFGHPSGRPFTSVKAFNPHMHWLMTDTTRTRKNCACELCAFYIHEKFDSRQGSHETTHPTNSHYQNQKRHHSSSISNHHQPLPTSQHHQPIHHHTAATSSSIHYDHHTSIPPTSSHEIYPHHAHYNSEHHGKQHYYENSQSYPVKNSYLSNSVDRISVLDGYSQAPSHQASHNADSHNYFVQSNANHHLRISDKTIGVDKNDNSDDYRRPPQTAITSTIAPGSSPSHQYLQRRNVAEYSDAPRSHESQSQPKHHQYIKPSSRQYRYSRAQNHLSRPLPKIQPAFTPGPCYSKDPSCFKGAEFHPYDLVWVPCMLMLRENRRSLSFRSSTLPLQSCSVSIEALRDGFIYWPALIQDVHLAPFKSVWYSPLCMEVTPESSVHVSSPQICKEVSETNIQYCYTLSLVKISDPNLEVVVAEEELKPFLLHMPPKEWCFSSRGDLWNCQQATTDPILRSFFESYFTSLERASGAHVLSPKPVSSLSNREPMNMLVLGPEIFQTDDVVRIQSFSANPLQVEYLKVKEVYFIKARDHVMVSGFLMKPQPATEMSSTAFYMGVNDDAWEHYLRDPEIIKLPGTSAGNNYVLFEFVPETGVIIELDYNMCHGRFYKRHVHLGADIQVKVNPSVSLIAP